jgi:small GTP-binding protein
MRVFKIVLIGDSGVGKTAIFNAYTQPTLAAQEGQATLSVEFAHRVFQGADGEYVKLQLWDTAGQERFRSITRSYYRGAHVLALVYDVTHRQSFLDLQTWVTDVRDALGSDQDVDIPFVVVANKRDLEAKREVGEEEGRRWAEDMLGYQGSARFFEVSARKGEDLRTLFETLVSHYTGLLAPETLRESREISAHLPAVLRLIPEVETDAAKSRCCS